MQTQSSILDAPSFLSIQPAKFGRRLLAYLIDMLLLMVGYIAVTSIGLLLISLSAAGSISTLQNQNSSEHITGLAGLLIGGFFLAVVLIYVLMLVLWWLYYAWFESRFGGTAGKLLLGLKVVDLWGAPVSFKRASGRFFSRWLSILTFYIGHLLAAFTEKNQSLHDMVAGCLVIESPTGPTP